MKYMSVKEFRELGILQELNRAFLHPLGLALEVVVHHFGHEEFGRVWMTDDPEGFTYEKDDPVKAKRFVEFKEKRR